MNVSFPNESPKYSITRNKLLEEEVALRRAMESVVATRDGTLTKMKFSELFAPDKNTLVVTQW
jgi:predicted dithiol-disulfide oxidoreductase (DUF899 family)